MKKHIFLLSILILGNFFLYPYICYAQNKDNPALIQQKNKSKVNLSLLNESRHSLEIAFNYLLKSQFTDGSWKNDPAISALVLYAFLLQPAYNPNDTTDMSINAGLAFIEKYVQPDGSIYKKGYKNYSTAVCLLPLIESDNKKYKTIISNAKNFLIKFQLDEEDGYQRTHAFYGGIGYGGDDRPDLSNLHMALEAIRGAENYEKKYNSIISENSKDLETEEKELGVHWQKALIFLARCQNVKAVNDMPYAKDDGGFIYETGTYKEERSHSYGSMTYAGVKSLVYAKVDKNDVRVRQAVKWIKDNYTLEENPGFNNATLYYYYDTFAKCMDALGEEIVVDSSGTKHYWREELVQKLISLQHEEGYWVNENGRYWENVKDLATAHAIIGMKYALKGLVGK